MEIVEWVNKKLTTGSRKASCGTLNHRMIDPLNLVYFGEFEGELFDAFIQVAKSTESFTAYHVAGSCAKIFKTEPNTVNLYRASDQTQLAYDGPPTVDAMFEWIADSSLPDVLTYNEETAELIFGSMRPALVLFADSNDSGEFRQVAKELREEGVLFVKSGTLMRTQQQLARMCGVGSTDGGVVLI